MFFLVNGVWNMLIASLSEELDFSPNKKGLLSMILNCIWYYSYYIEPCTKNLKNTLNKLLYKKFKYESIRNAIPSQRDIK